jgi:hypothetical protein
LRIKKPRKSCASARPLAQVAYRIRDAALHFANHGAIGFGKMRGFPSIRTNLTQIAILTLKSIKRSAK